RGEGMGDMLNMAPKRLISPLCDSYLTPANLSYSIKVVEWEWV
ncbi:unnamed protein product, partial [marine sediment metagenome]